MATKRFTLWTPGPNMNPNAAKAVIAGKFGGVELDWVSNFEFGKTNKTEEYLKKNPNGQVPTLDTPDGSIFESIAIAYYVARAGTDAAGLLGENAFAQSQVDQWVQFARSRFEGIFHLFAYSIPAYNTKFDQTAFETAKKKVVDGFAVMEVYFKNHPTRKYLVNDRVTLADIIVICSLYMALKAGIDEEAVNHYPKVKAYLNHLLAEPHVKSVIGDIHILAKFTPPAAQ